VLGVRAPVMWSLLSQSDKRRLRDICLPWGGPKVPKDLLSVVLLTFPTSHHPPCAASGLLPPFSLTVLILDLPSFSPPFFLFSRMPDIAPSTPGGGAQPVLQSTTSSINAQFLNAVTRGDEQYARSLLARGADVNATDATGRSTVACVLAGERCASARVSG